MDKLLKYVLIAISLCPMMSCIDYGPVSGEEFPIAQEQHGLFIINEGNFMYGNASLSYYNIDSKTIENEAFLKVNGINLGDVAQSMTINDNKGYIVVNNSGIVFIVDINTLEVTGTITGLVSPRNIFVSNQKTYITDLYSSTITVVDPENSSIVNHIKTPGHPSTEDIVAYYNKLFVSCWSYDNTILIIDNQTDMIIDSIRVGFQPTSMVIDKNDKIWVTTKGITDDESSPALYKIDAQSHTIEKIFHLPFPDSCLELALNETRDTLYYLNKHVWKLATDSNDLPSRPFILSHNTLFYNIGIDPVSSELYVADAIDYVQPGVVFRYSPNACPIDTFKAGISPGDFCFK